MRRPLPPDPASRFRAAAHEALFGHAIASSGGNEIEGLAKRLHHMFGVRLMDAQDAIAETLRLVETNVRERWYLRFYRLPDSDARAELEHAERDDLRLDSDHVRAYVWRHVRGRCLDARRASVWIEPPESLAAPHPGPDEVYDIRLRLLEAMEHAKRELDDERERYRFAELQTWIDSQARAEDRELLDGYLRGLSEQEIADRLGLDPRSGAVRQRKLRLLTGLGRRDAHLPHCFRVIVAAARRRRR